MPEEFVLTELITVSANGSQPVDQAIDIGRHKTLVVQVRRPAHATAGNLYLQHSLKRQDEFFVDVSASADFSLASGDAEIKSFSDLGRFLRWRVDELNGTATFAIWVLGREV